jgi:nitroreductase
MYDLSVGMVKNRDEGIAVQTILLGATEKGLGGCMFGSVNRKKLAESFDIDTEKYYDVVCPVCGATLSYMLWQIEDDNVVECPMCASEFELSIEYY